MMKGVTAGSRMVLFIGALLVAMLSLPFIQKGLTPILESTGQARAIAVSYFVASSINALSAVEQGYITKEFDKPVAMEIYLKKGLKCKILPWEKDCGWYVKAYYGDGKSKEARIIGDAQPVEKQEFISIYITKKLGEPVTIIEESRDLCQKASISEIDNYVEEASERFRIDKKLILAVIKQESSFDSCAVSPKGALGLMQITPSTGRSLSSEDLNCENLIDARTNVLCGTKYLQQLFERFKNKDLALAAYNAGPANVEKYNGIPPFTETQNYIKKVNSYYERCCTEQCTAEVFARCEV